MNLLSLSRGLICAAFFACAPASVWADAHSDGIALGQSQLNTMSGNVNSSKAQGVPFYNTNPPQSAGFGGPSLFDLGLNRINTCKTATHGSDPIANQECDAVNFLAKNPQNRQKFEVSPNDPIIVGIGDVINKADPGKVDAGCILKQTTTPAEHSTEVCNEYLVPNEFQCAIGRVVDVDADANFSCDKQFEMYENRSCEIGTMCNVVGTQLTCTPMSFQCTSTGQACCNFTISCNGDGSTATVVYNDCCGAHQVKTAAVSDLLNSGINYNPIDYSRLYCNSTGNCWVDFADYQCGDWAPLGYYPHVNTFNLNQKAVFQCFDSNNCGALESLTW